MRTANDFYIVDEIRNWSRSRLAKGGRVLDLGCGASPYAPILSEQGAEIVSMDLERRGPLTQVLADASALPFKSQVFDAVLLSEVLEHVPEPALVISEVVRVLKPGGTLFLSTPLHYSIHEIPHDYFRPTEYGISTLLSARGVSIERFIRRGGLLTMTATISVQVALAILELPRRLPLVGRIYASLVYPVAERAGEMVGFLAFRIAHNRPALQKDLKGVRGLSRALMLWTNGYCIVARKH